MNIIIIPSFYPDNSNSNLGSFVKEQVATITEFGITANVFYVEQKSLRLLSLKNLQENHFQLVKIEESKWNEYRIKGWNLPGKIGKRIWIYLSTRLVNQFIENTQKPDLIHAHNIFWAGVVAHNIWKKHEIPYIITEHSSSFLIQNQLTDDEILIAKKTYTSASKIISVSKSLQSSINKIVPSLKIEIIPNIVDTDFFLPIHNKKSCLDSTKFISIGNLYKNKGHDILIDAFYEVSKMRKHVSLTICGDGIEKVNLQTKVTGLGLSDKVFFAGQLEKAQILEKLNQADCLVHSSYFETFGIVLIEALSCGVPIISTKCGGPEDIYEENTGYIVEKGNPKLLAEAMLCFINQKDKFVASNLRKIAVTKYSRQSIFERLKEVYEAIITNVK